MTITAKWTTACAGCEKVAETELTLTKDNWRGLGYTDIWGPGWPDGWMQVTHDEPTDSFYLFFHDHDCYKGWLKEQGRLEEIEEFETGVWIA